MNPYRGVTTFDVEPRQYQQGDTVRVRDILSRRTMTMWLRRSSC